MPEEYCLIFGCESSLDGDAVLRGVLVVVSLLAVGVLARWVARLK